MQHFRAHLDILRENCPEVVKRINEGAKLFTRGKSVYCRLLEERVSIKDQVTILETLVEYEEDDLHPFFLTEIVRKALGDLICQAYARSEGEIYAVTLSTELQELCFESLKRDKRKAWLEPTMEASKELRLAMKGAVEQIQEEGHRAILVTPPTLRRPLLDFFRRDIPKLVVLSQEEIPYHIEVRSLGDVAHLRTRPKRAGSRPYPRGKRGGPSFLGSSR